MGGSYRTVRSQISAGRACALFLDGWLSARDCDLPGEPSQWSYSAVLPILAKSSLSWVLTSGKAAFGREISLEIARRTRTNQCRRIPPTNGIGSTANICAKSGRNRLHSATVRRSYYCPGWVHPSSLRCRKERHTSSRWRRVVDTFSLKVSPTPGWGFCGLCF